MEADKEVVVDGHRVFCRITRQGERSYSVVIATSRQDSLDRPAQLLWRAAATQNFDSREDAERHARYVLLGICAVKQDGEPVLSVT
ncbi:hypothetical protein [Bordetella genomosp. 9]|uniref:Uncharacterized protein n=1 Tax=Bordetella genomosp. 9 TaxID=1416803 RepID=A0A1W6Z2A3_9BORD|nr:hypothetical protein [Bordetella genomosp. 9]ARP87448.1 hypothetical protein CAL13_15445 [Bordetella genomosp. 9]ARP91430.1 hypothetical protein CAL14_14975 [Bordetella genomosp. 9]